MSWRDNKKVRGGYACGRAYRQHRGVRNSHHDSSGTRGEDGDGGQRRYSRSYGRGNDGGRHYKRPQINHSYDGKRAKYEVGERLKEDNIGVTELVGNHKRFAGIVKERYGDFHVHEISCDGDICKLTNQDLPPEPQDLRDIVELKKSIPPDVRDKLEELPKNDSAMSTLEFDVTYMDKEIRRNIHIIAKRTPSVVSETVDRDGKKVIIIAKKQGDSGHKFRGDQREDWSCREGNYCHFLLHKVNMDTMEALNQLALKLRLKTDAFHYAGMKDRRARTTQWVSLKKVNPPNIHNAAKQVPGAVVGNFKFVKEPLRLGLLNGNHFRIALRSIDGNDEEIEHAVNSLQSNGFINYYGLQRFGTIATIPTHDIGKALLQGNWEEAIELILKPRNGEQQRDMIEARKIYHETKNAEAALKPIAKSGKIEAKLLKGIVVSGANNPLGALDHIPRNARLMYIHSYQSWVWNHMVSRRFRQLGSNPVVGDLVYDNNDSKNNIEAEIIHYAVHNDNDKDGTLEKPEQLRMLVEPKKMIRKDVGESSAASKEDKLDDEKSSMKTENCKHFDIPMGKISKITVLNDEVKEQVGLENESLDEPKDQSNVLTQVKALTEEDLGNYTLADVVMPKPGWKVSYPAYAKPWFDEFLAKDNLTTDLRQKNMRYSLGGGYRKILEKPGNLSWRIARYNGYHDDLILSDVDEMRGIELPGQDPDGKYKALILEFSLPPSTYATMALREILEHDTSAQTQAAQSTVNQAQERKEGESKKMEIDVQPAGGQNKPKDAEAKSITNDLTTDTDDTALLGDSNTRANIEREGDDNMGYAQSEAHIPEIVETAKINTKSNEISDIIHKAVKNP